MHFSTLSAVAMLCTCAYGEDLLSAAATVTDIKSLEKAMSSNWASVYYQVNQNLESLHYLGKPGEYEDATSLYGTDRIPASYIPTWPAGFQSRAEELAKQSPGSSASESDESSETESDNETESESDDVESESSDAPRGALALGRVAGAVVAAVAVLSCM